MSELRRWSVAGGVVLNPDDHVLLVKNQRRGGLIDWSTPGGVIDDGEEILTGLTREVREETGLAVIRWTEPIYRIEVVAPGYGFHLRVEARRAVTYDGDLIIDDPDGIVTEASFLSTTIACERLESAPQWVAEPLIDYLNDPVGDGRLYKYRLEGSNAADRRVIRL